MKKILDYNTYLSSLSIHYNESIRDHMTPKPSENILQHLLKDSTVYSRDIILQKINATDPLERDGERFTDILTELYPDFDLKYMGETNGYKLYEMFIQGWDILFYDVWEEEINKIDELCDLLKPLGWKIFDFIWLENNSHCQNIFTKMTH